MFTGIVAGTGEVRGVEPLAGGLRAAVDLGSLAAEARPGDSVCVSGCCLTVAAQEESVATFDLSPETLERTWFQDLRPGRKVNLELALRASDRLGGHFVTGHVDGLGRTLERRPAGDFLDLVWEVPEAFQAFLAEKGSVAVDGVSLTVAALEGRVFRAALIPETLERTTLGALRPGDPVHLEADPIARQVLRFLELRFPPETG